MQEEEPSKNDLIPKRPKIGIFGLRKRSIDLVSKSGQPRAKGHLGFSTKVDHDLGSHYMDYWACKCLPPVVGHVHNSSFHKHVG